MGIDIRDGLQLECIQCALCIDACDSIMDRVGRPRGLIGYDSLQNQQARISGTGDQTKVVRPRTIIYVVVLALVSVIMLGALLLRAETEVNVIADRNPLFVRLSNGDLRNGYTVKILNKGDRLANFAVSAEGLEGATLSRGRSRDASSLTLVVPADSLEDAKYFVQLPHETFRRLTEDSNTITFNMVITNMETQQRVIEQVSFKGPIK